MRSSARACLVVATVALIGLLPTAAHAAEQPQRAERRVSRHLNAAIDELRVGAENHAGYERDRFHAWITWPGGCDTRARVLKAESRAPVTTTGDCIVRRGRWFSYYDGETWQQASSLDIDHLVPLSEAWASGARRWNADTLERFGNDLVDRRSLVAVTSSVNRSKGDQDPSEWMPDRAHCRYIAEWVAVKMRWRLKANGAEKRALRQEAQGCGNPVITVTLARVRLHGSGGGGGGGDCHPSYPTVCIPPPPPDLDCAGVPYTNFTVVGSDPHGFDGDNDGVGCET